MRARPTTPADAAEVVRLASVMYESMGLDTSAAPWRAEAERVVRERAGSDRCALFVVDHPDHDGRLIALGGVTIHTKLPGPGVPTARFAYIQWMATDPDHRRSGHARAVFEAILAWLHERGVGNVELHATAEGEPLYRSYGFNDPRYPQLRARLQL